MTRKLRYLIAFLAYPIVAASSAMAANIPPDLKKAITFIFLADDKGGLAHDPQTQAPEANGTGFFVGVPSEKDPSRVFCYLVTAKHVIEDSSGTFFQRIYLRLNKKAGDVDFPSVDLTRDGHSAVVVSPDPTVDIAVVQVAPNETTYDFKMIPAAMLTTEESHQGTSYWRRYGRLLCGLVCNLLRRASEQSYCPVREGLKCCRKTGFCGRRTALSQRKKISYICWKPNLTAGTAALRCSI